MGGLVEDTPHAKVAVLDVNTWSWLELSLADETLPKPSGRYGVVVSIEGGAGLCCATMETVDGLSWPKRVLAIQPKSCSKLALTRCCCCFLLPLLSLTFNLIGNP